MILRKPYAFLIKKFKLIHLILTGILIYICYKSYKILSFFNTYIASSRHDVIDGLSDNYLGPLVYIAILFVIFISIFIFLLMKNKDKPYKYYLASIIYYFLFILCQQRLSRAGLPFSLCLRRRRCPGCRPYRQTVHRGIFAWFRRPAPRWTAPFRPGW